MAKEEVPSILLLEDLNLYVESTSPYAPEWLVCKPVLMMQRIQIFCDCYY